MTKVYIEDNYLMVLIPIIALLASCNVFLLVLCINCFKKKFKSSDEDVLVDNQENVAVNVYAGVGDLIPPSQSTPAGSILIGGSDANETSRLSSGFPRSQLNYVAEVGRGWFGIVLLGEAHKLQTGVKKTKVVIKQLRDSASQEEQNYFLQEVQPFRELKHANILPLMGQCTDGHPLLIILEYCALGDLKGYLLRHAIDGYSLSNQGNILLCMACDMASGLQCMHEANLIHGDFAARNCLVSMDITIKVGDYGIAQDKYKNDYYITDDGMSVLPVRWLAPETVAFERGHIEAKGITKESNVWSFGIVLWELLQFAQQPYSKLSDEQVIEEVLLNQIVKPTYSDVEIKNGDRWSEIMQSCFLDAKNRPSMKDIHPLLIHLKDQINDSSSTHNIADFDEKWNSLVPTQIKIMKNNEDNGNPNLINENFETNFVDTNFEKPDSIDTSLSDRSSLNSEKASYNLIDPQPTTDNNCLEKNLSSDSNNLLEIDSNQITEENNLPYNDAKISDIREGSGSLCDDNFTSLSNNSEKASDNLIDPQPTTDNNCSEDNLSSNSNNLLENDSNQITEDDNLPNIDMKISDTKEEDSLCDDKLDEKNTISTSVEIQDKEATSSCIQLPDNIIDNNTNDHNNVSQLTMSIDDDQIINPTDSLIEKDKEKITDVIEQ